MATATTSPRSSPPPLPARSTPPQPVKLATPPPTTADAKVPPGDIVRYDFILNAAPAAPSGLSATATSSSQINLAWTDNASSETGFVVARATVSGGPYTDIVTLAANSTNYTDSGLAASTTYYYVVRATNSLASSPNSNEASATTAPGAPSPPTISAQPQGLTVVAGQN